MSDLKNTWKEVGKGLGFAFRDLGKAVVSTAKTGVDKVDDWANGESKKEDAKSENQQENK